MQHLSVSRRRFLKTGGILICRCCGCRMRSGCFILGLGSHRGQWQQREMEEGALPFLWSWLRLTHWRRWWASSGCEGRSGLRSK